MPLLRPAAFLLLLALLVSPSTPCQTTSDCGYGGVCTPSNTCACNPEWSGPNCTQLNLTPADTGYAHRVVNTSFWGGSVVKVNQTYWMAYAEMAGHCGLNSWESNSAIALGSSPTPQGPYTKVSLLLPPFGHNPTLHKLPNGSLVIAHIGQGVAYKKPFTNCTNGTTPVGGEQPPFISARPQELTLGVPGTLLPPPNFILLPSGDPSDGTPWIAINSTGGAWAANNPALHIDSDGKALLVYKTHCACPGGCFCAQFGVAIADSWDGPYTDQGFVNVFGEDAYVWKDGGGGGWHMLFQGGSYAPMYPTYQGHWHTAYSPNGLNWTVAADSMVFDGSISLSSGGNVELGRRERHQVLFDDAGVPRYLFNGAQLQGVAGDATFTSVQPIAGGFP